MRRPSSLDPVRPGPPRERARGAFGLRPSAESLDRRLMPATAAWSQVGTIGGVAAIVDQVNGGAELLAQKADGSIWVESGGQWTAAGGALVPGTVFADGSTILGVAGGGTVWQYQVGGGWSRVGTLDGVTQVVDSVDVVPNGAPDMGISDVPRYYAERSDGSVWVITPSDTDPAWVATGGTLEPGTMVVDETGIAGVAGGGTVFAYTTETGWAQVGSLSGVDSLLCLAGDMLARRGDDSIWFRQGGDWTSTGGYLVPGTLIVGGVTTSGVTTFEGVAGGGTVWQYFPFGTWSQVGTISGVRALAESANSAGQQTLYAQLGDGSVSAYTFGLGRWVATGGALLPGTMQATSPGVVGVAGGGTVFEEDQAGGQADPFQGATAVFGVDGYTNAGVTTSDVPNIAFARTSDGMIWQFTSTGWTRTGQPLVPGSVVAQDSGSINLAGYDSALNHPSLIGVTPGGHVWEEGFGQVGSLDDVARLAAGDADLFAQRADGSVWSLDDANNIPTWSATGGTVVSGTLITFGSGAAGVAGGGTVWAYGDSRGWAQLGTLDGVARLVSAPGPSGGGELFAQRADGSVWAYDATKGAWTATGGTIVPGTLVADADGVAGIAGGGTAWAYADGKGWSRLGSLTGAASLVYSPNDAGTGTFFAQAGDGSVSSYEPTVDTWVASGGVLAPGTMTPFNGGVMGVAGAGTVYGFVPGVGWTPYALFD
jgi:hypothetical protein